MILNTGRLSWLWEIDEIISLIKPCNYLNIQMLFLLTKQIVCSVQTTYARQRLFKLLLTLWLIWNGCLVWSLTVTYSFVILHFIVSKLHGLELDSIMICIYTWLCIALHGTVYLENVVFDCVFLRSESQLLRLDCELRIMCIWTLTNIVICLYIVSSILSS